MAALQLNLILDDSLVVYRAYSRVLDIDGRVQDKDFLLRPTEESLSVALTGDKAMGDLKVRGYVPITVGSIRKIGLDVVPKRGENDPELLEITGIPHGPDAEGFAITLAARAGRPVEVPGRRNQRVIGPPEG